jgi:hypothetical protein
MPISYPDRQISYELARVSYDYDRGVVTLIWREIVSGTNQPSLKTTVVKVADMLAALPQEMAATYLWMANNAMAKGDIPPNGQIAP